MQPSLTGTRIREYRRRAGLSQTALAADVGISTSYLNLIEHNKRRIAGKVLQSIARALDVQPADLSEIADTALLETLASASEALPKFKAENAVLTELVGRFPGWSAMIAELFQRNQNQTTEIEILTDRLTHDPFLEDSLHQMLSNITAIRSTASILTSVGDIPMAQMSRFQTAIHEESRRLSDSAESLVEYFDRSASEGIQAATPDEELENFLAAHEYHFPDLDTATTKKTAINQLIKSATALQTTAGKDLARAALSIYFEDAQILPLSEFAKAAKAAHWNAAELAAQFHTDLHRVFRRLACLRRDEIAAPNMGLMMVNAAGQPILRRPIDGFPMPRHNTTCPLWPVYQCLAAPGRATQSIITLPDDTSFVSFAVAQPTKPVTFDQPTSHIGAMLIVHAEEATRSFPWLGDLSTQNVGTNCRISPCGGCAS